MRLNLALAFVWLFVMAEIMVYTVKDEPQWVVAWLMWVVAGLFVGGVRINEATP